MESMKKYPVTYKGEEYEVRWETSAGGFYDYISLYKVKHKTTILKKDKVIYEEIYKEEINNDTYFDLILQVNRDNEDYYIKQVQLLFKLWEDHEKAKANANNKINRQKNALDEWDGVIE